jgi:uncharacterized protein YbaR (Trm112 family)
MVSKELLDILVCPICKISVRIDEQNTYLICDNCKKKYPIRDDIPIMLPQEAKDLDE